MSDIAGLPFCELHFDKTGRIVKHAQPVPHQVTDLFVFAHAWNNDYTDAKDLHNSFFEKLAEELLQHEACPTLRIALAGVYWPCVLWPEDEPPHELVGLANFGPTDRDWAHELKKAFDTADQRQAIDRMRELLRAHPPEDDAISEFRRCLDTFHSANGLNGDAASTFDELADRASEQLPMGRNYPESFARMWRGAREAARRVSYRALEERAQIVGNRGLGPLLRTYRPDLRVHLIGHSFGARLAASALQAHPDTVKSLCLLQGPVSENEASALGEAVGGPIVRLGDEPWPFGPRETFISPENATAILQAAGALKRPT